MPLVNIVDKSGSKVCVAAGLNWHSKSDSKAIKRWRPQRADKFYTSVDVAGKVKQLGTSADSKLKGHPSAAAIISSANKEGRFFIILSAELAGSKSGEEKYWLVGIDSGEVLPGTDIVGSAEIIGNEIDALLNIYGDQFKVYAPGNERLFDADVVKELHLIDKLLINNQSKITQFSGFTWVYIAVGLIVIFALSNQGYAVYKRVAEEARLANLKAQKAIAKNEINVEEIKEKILEIEKKEISEKLSRFDAKNQIDMTIKESLNLPVRLNGWRFTSVGFALDERATNGSLTISAIRIGGFVSGIQEATRFEDWEIKLGKVGNDATVIKTFKYVPSDELAEDYVSSFRGTVKGEYEITDFAQRNKLQYKFSKTVPLGLPPGTSKLATEAKITVSVSGYKTGDFELSGSNLMQLDNTAKMFANHKHDFQIKALNISTTYPHKWKIKAARYVKD